MLRTTTACFCLAALPAFAVDEEIDELFDALRLGEVIGAMRYEGLAYGADLQANLFPGRGGGEWGIVLDEIYAIDRMEASVRGRFEEALAGVDVGPLVEFYTSDRGAAIVALELEARRAMQDEMVAAAAEERAADMRSAGTDRWSQIDELVETNRLIDENVVGALNASYAFHTGLADGGAFRDRPSEGQLLADVRAQERGIRAETIDWIHSYLALAYQPLSDDDLDVYIALGRTDRGRAMNDAIFTAFNDMHVDISRELGLRAASFMAGEDI